jgi:redox-sensitive bicupin YhaK (pirin superfamily)
MLDGTVEHGDSLGNKGTIGAGDVQWMTAGNGIIHQEMPQGDQNGRMGGFQLWANLPAADKMMDPRYRDIQTTDIPEVVLAGNTRIKIIAGKIEGTDGPVQDIVIDPQYLDITVPANSKYEHPTKPGHTVFAYVIEGSGYFCKEKKPLSFAAEGINYFDMQTEPLVGDGTLILFEDGETVYTETANESMRFLLVSGRPINEPVAWHGPIVMNTQEELRIAFEEYRQGTFLKHKQE